MYDETVAHELNFVKKKKIYRNRLVTKSKGRCFYPTFLQLTSTRVMGSCLYQALTRNGSRKFRERELGDLP